MKRNWKCFFGFHIWGKWYDLAEGSASNLLGQEQNALFQERICEVCNMKDRQYILFKKGN
jgi:hypothetical protein